ncbi:hypothetical protein Sango_1756900 [Sesamum angolense]|uniref:Uncharacterized protein n=1 Tax=Sesamum angolense TaxID=2727404 RepID=A0AAE1WGF0_9LAMI|nr:hypothetical protein Sango_1756900 [Sesamum angolense]
MLPNSITLVLAGNWNKSPGERRMNITTATTTGPQSALIILLQCVSNVNLWAMSCYTTEWFFLVKKAESESESESESDAKLKAEGEKESTVGFKRGGKYINYRGLLFQLPGKRRAIEFTNMQTSGLSIFVHTIIFTAIITILLIAIGVHIYVG